jgi:hypothetical protein
MGNRTQESVNLFRDMADIWMKIVITIVISGLYSASIIILLVKISQDSPWQNNLILGAVDVMLTYSVPIMIRHFFPKRDSQD